MAWTVSHTWSCFWQASNKVLIWNQCACVCQSSVWWGAGCVAVHMLAKKGVIISVILCLKWKQITHFPVVTPVSQTSETHVSGGHITEVRLTTFKQHQWLPYHSIYYCVVLCCVILTWNARLILIVLDKCSHGNNEDAGCVVEGLDHEKFYLQSTQSFCGDSSCVKLSQKSFWAISATFLCDCVWTWCWLTGRKLRCHKDVTRALLM